MNYSRTDLATETIVEPVHGVVGVLSGVTVEPFQNGPLDILALKELSRLLYDKCAGFVTTSTFNPLQLPEDRAELIAATNAFFPETGSRRIRRSAQFRGWMSVVATHRVEFSGELGTQSLLYGFGYLQYVGGVYRLTTGDFEEVLKLRQEPQGPEVETEAPSEPTAPGPVTAEEPSAN